MKVLIIGGYSTPSIRSRMMIDLLLREGHEIVYESDEEVEQRRRRANGLHLFTVWDECTMLNPSIPEMDAEFKRREPKGPRGRWGKLK